MALFANNKKKEVAQKPSSIRTAPVDLSWVLRNPHITEKATDVSGRGVYVFDIASDANKTQVARAVASVYNVTPVRVNIVRTSGKTVRNPRTGMIGSTGNTKKAYVYLKKGDSISIM